MSNFKFDLSFRIFHPSMDVGGIITKLNMKPAFSKNIGEQRKTPKGKLLSGIYDSSYVSFKLDEPNITVLSECIAYWNKYLLKYKEFLKEIYSSGGKLEYFIGWYSEGNSGEVFEIDLMKELVDLGINIALDIYAE